MNAHALGILEFPRLVAYVAGRAQSSPGAAAVRALTPVNERTVIEAEHARVAALRSLITSEAGWTQENFPELTDALSRLRIEGISWSAEELLHGMQLLRASRRTRAALNDARRPAVSVAMLRIYAQQLVDLHVQEEAISRSIADDGSVRDEILVTTLQGSFRYEVLGTEIVLPGDVEVVADQGPGRWTMATKVQFASKLLSAAYAAGLVASRRDPRPLTVPRVPDDALEYLLYLLREVEFEGTLLDNPYVASVGLDGRPVCSISVTTSPALRRMPL